MDKIAQTKSDKFSSIGMNGYLIILRLDNFHVTKTMTICQELIKHLNILLLKRLSLIM